jgi:hypothetical protein
MLKGGVAAYHKLFPSPSLMSMQRPSLTGDLEQAEKMGEQVGYCYIEMLSEYFPVKE